MACEIKDAGKYVLGIECSNPGACVGGFGEVGIGRLVDDGSGVGSVGGAGGGIEFLGSMGLDGAGRGSDGLMQAIGGLFGRHGVSGGDLGRVVVSVGPGGYTGLRVSVTVGKVLGLVEGCGVVGVPTAAVAWAGLGGGGARGDGVIALASKKGGAHCTRVGCGGVEEVGVLDAAGLGVYLAGAGGGGLGWIAGDGHVPREMIDVAGEGGLEHVGLKLGVRACFEASRGFEVIEAGCLSVLYAREPDAVTQWRARRG